MMDLCVECKKDTSLGTGNFINRFSLKDGKEEGFLCVDCQSLECDTCNKKTTEYQLDGDVICMECIATTGDIS
tara:strand:+ start:319 stop:537 length:219 start_codon:yes stop_codon:yes gene_type:complete